ncbi:uncharacterized protein LOC111247037 isoform X2 [Varroa destructor]|uniref:BRCT domain-containing protein n=1 Tax=Varroa destructor TaxID=109461 RepID=A0A7M7JKF6_VARDE|nr:uncharacterized protein LOC111247037 isoform X2 [Varroa destructor]
MQVIPVEKVLDVSSEHSDHKAVSLVTGFGQWKTELPGEEKAELLLRLGQLHRIARIEVANESSAWLDIRVSREGTPFVALLPTLCLQSRKESKEGNNARGRKILEAKHFNEELRQDKFDLVKIICRQPFNRSILFGLSHLKFFTYPPEEEDKKNRLRNPSGTCVDKGEEIVLDIVHNPKKNKTEGNEVAAVAIKNACIQDINREKRFVNSPLNDGDSDSYDGSNGLRAKSLLKHFTDSASFSTTVNNLKRTAFANRSPGVVKPSFVFAPKTSAAEQEARAKKAAAAADEIIPGKSPKKPRVLAAFASCPSTAKQTPICNSSTTTSLDNNAEKDIDQRFLQHSFSKWKKKGKTAKTQEGEVEFAQTVTSSPIKTSRKTRSSSPSLRVRSSTVVRKLQDSGDKHGSSTDAETDEARRVPPPKVRTSMLELSTELRAFKRRSVAEGRTDQKSVFAAAGASTNKKARSSGDILQKIFSSSEDESTAAPVTSANNNHNPNSANQSAETQHKTLRNHPIGHSSSLYQTEDDISEDSEPQPGPSWRIDPPRKKRAVNGEIFKEMARKKAKNGLNEAAALNYTKPRGSPPEYGSIDSRDTADSTTTLPSIVVKSEVRSDDEDLPIMIKNEVIELGDSDDTIDLEVSKSNKENGQHRRRKNHNPPVNCEVDSDSDLEVVGNKLMRGVVFALSGFKNPYRASLRGMAISMGAKYRPHWDDTCTHLVCAFKNTPKFNEVHRKGGRIVTAAWIATSHLNQKLSYWKNYRLD